MAGAFESFCVCKEGVADLIPPIFYEYEYLKVFVADTQMYLEAKEKHQAQSGEKKSLAYSMLQMVVDPGYSVSSPDWANQLSVHRYLFARLQVAFAENGNKPVRLVPNFEYSQDNVDALRHGRNFIRSGIMDADGRLNPEVYEFFEPALSAFFNDEVCPGAVIEQEIVRGIVMADVGKYCKIFPRR